VAFGAAVWMLADEVALPLLDLTPPPEAIPLSIHLYALTAHLVYGLATRRMLRFTRRIF